MLPLDGSLGLGDPAGGHQQPDEPQGHGVQRHAQNEASRPEVGHRLGAGHDSQTVTTALQTMVADLPRAVRASITWDQGSEMAQHAAFTAATDIPVYFADPHSPWQRGSNENANGLLREFFPKGSDFATVGQGEIVDALAKINGRPRKCLGWKTAHEAFTEEVLRLI